MGTEDVKTNVPEVTSNGDNLPKKAVENVTKKKESNNGVKELKGDSKSEEKDEVDKMKEKEVEKVPEDDEVNKEDKPEPMEEEKDEKGSEDKEVKEENKPEPMEEEKTLNEDEKNELEGEKEKIDESEEDDDDVKRKEEETIKVKESKNGSRKRARGRNTGDSGTMNKNVKEKSEPEQRTPAATNRPVRERKSVERLVASIDKDAGREFHIEKGRGTALKDIPNVAYKLSKKKNEDTLKLLHTILFARRGKAAQIKSNISRFSGFVWRENEEKQRMKIIEKLDKCVKEKLLELCDLLDLPFTKTTTKKEDMIAKLTEFLEAPHATTTELLAEKDQSNKGKKRKKEAKESGSKSGKTSSSRSDKSRKKTAHSSKGEAKQSASETDNSEEEEEEDEKDNGLPKGREEEKSEDSKSKGKTGKSGDGSENDEGIANQRSKKSSVKKEIARKAKIKDIGGSKKAKSLPKSPEKQSSKPSKGIDGGDASPKVFSRKKKNEDNNTKGKSLASQKSAPKEKSGKKVAKSKGKAKEPSDDELRNAVCNILKEVDFNTATFTDILKLLAKQFNMDFAPRKLFIKFIIQEELTKLADEADDEENEDREDAEKKEAHPAAASKEVKV